MHWPLLIRLAPADLTTLDRADAIVELERVIAGPPASVLAAFFDDATSQATPTMSGFRWHTPKGDLDGAVVDEFFTFMTLRLRTVIYEPGVRVGMSIDRSSMPLASELFELVEVAPCEGGCRVRWRIALRFLPLLRFVTPTGLVLFRKLFEAVLDTIERQFARKT